jgi:hypothetical protein
LDTSAVALMPMIIGTEKHNELVVCPSNYKFVL